MPAKRRVRRHRKVITPQGPDIRVVECLDDSNGIVNWTGEDYFSVILREFLGTHTTPCGPVGGATGELLPARDLVVFAAGWMTAHFVRR